MALRRAKRKNNETQSRFSVVSQFEYPPWVESGPLVIGHTGNATRRSCPTSPCNVGLSYSEEPGWRFCSMAKLVYGLSQSLDGYVDHMKIGPPDPALSRHFIEQARGLTGAVYGRRMYEIMRYWDDDLPDWDAEDRDFAAVWRSQRK